MREQGDADSSRGGILDSGKARRNRLATKCAPRAMDAPTGRRAANGLAPGTIARRAGDGRAVAAHAEHLDAERRGRDLDRIPAARIARSVVRGPGVGWHAAYYGEEQRARDGTGKRHGHDSHPVADEFHCRAFLRSPEHRAPPYRAGNRPMRHCLDAPGPPHGFRGVAAALRWRHCWRRRRKAQWPVDEARESGNEVTPPPTRRRARRKKQGRSRLPGAAL